MTSDRSQPNLPHRLSALLLALAVALTSLVPMALADDWPQWRGTNRDGKSAETGLLTAWPEGGPALAWRAAGVGNGYASLAVVGEHIYTTGDLEKGQHVLALNRKDGSRVWATLIGPVWEDKYIGSRSTPTIDGGQAFVVSTEGSVIALDAKTGKAQWRRSLTEEFGGGLMQAMGKMDWKFSESPLVDGGWVIVTPGGEKAALVALDRKTGKELWRTTMPTLGEKGTDGAGYSSAVVSEAAGVRQYVQLLGRGVIGVAADSGRFLWGYNAVANDIANITTPIIQDDLVFVSTAYGAGSALLRLSKTEDGVGAEEVYFLSHETLQNHHGGLILHDGHVYGGTGHGKGFPIAVELATGKVAWGPIRNEGRGSAALGFADGHLYFRYENGLMVLVEATPEEYREKGSFMIPEVDQFSWSQPVISGGTLFLREQDNLFAYTIEKK